MACEIEAKYRLHDPAALRRRLIENGARCEGLLHENDVLFDTPGGGLRIAGCGLRLRTCCATADAAADKTAVLTFKGPRAAAALKIREELETTVTDATAMAAILARLGLAPTVEYQKRREVWWLDSCEICVDELPRLGWFAEIEGPDESAVAEMSERLQLDPAALIQETYVSLSQRHGTSDGTGYPRLAFDA